MTTAPEISSQDTAAVENELDAHSLDAIRSILTEEDAAAPRQTLQRGKPVEAEPPRPVAQLRCKAQQFPQLDAPPEDGEDHFAPKAAKKRFSMRRTPKTVVSKPEAPLKERAVKPADHIIVTRIKSFRPKPAHIALAVFVLLILLRPWLMLGLLFLFMIITTGVFLITGYDGFWQGAKKSGRWYARRRPARAAVLQARLDRFAMRWDAVLDRFPEGTVDGLYLPDFGEMATAEDRHSEAMERRLACLQGKGA